MMSLLLVDKNAYNLNNLHLWKTKKALLLVGYFDIVNGHQRTKRSNDLLYCTSKINLLQYHIEYRTL
jgi:hypothetical protein